MWQTRMKRCDVRDLGEYIDVLEEQGGGLVNPALYARNVMADYTTYTLYRDGGTPFFLLFEHVGHGIFFAHISGKPESFKKAKQFIREVGRQFFLGDCESIWCAVREDERPLQILLGQLKFKRIGNNKGILLYAFNKEDRTEEDTLCQQ